MFKVEITSIPASSSSTTSCQRFSLRDPGHVRVRELVDQGLHGFASQDRVDVHLLERRAAVFELPPRNDLEACDLFGGLRPIVRLDESDDDVGPALVAAATFVQHGERLADAGCCPQVDA